MASKTCPNGHTYDYNVYGDNCPFCPKSNGGGHTQVNPGYGYNATQVNNDGGGYNATQVNNDGHTVAGGYNPTDVFHGPTEVVNDNNDGGGHTIIRGLGTGVSSQQDARRVVAILVTYTWNPNGDVHKLYQGNNIIGRSASSNIAIPNDNGVSGTHASILYREGDGIYNFIDKDSSNGSYVNGQFTTRTELHTGDIIKVGETRFVFLAIPKF